MASPSVSAIDPRRRGQYTLKIGKDLTSGSASASYSRPNLSNGSRSTKLSRGSDGNATLSIKDEEGGSTSRYAYKGQRNTSKSSYVLIFDPHTQSCTLEPAKSSYNFNLTSTPWETSKEKLARQYEQLETADHGGVDVDPDGEPVADNPYDFRHYLNLNSKPSPSPSPALRTTSTVHTPNLGSSRPSAQSSASKPQSRPASKVDPLRQAPRKQKPASSENKTHSRPTPTVRLDRRASTRPGDPPEKKTSKPAAKPAAKGTAKSDYYVHSSDDDEDDAVADTGAGKTIDAEESGGLEIDWGNDRPRARKPPARALDLPTPGHYGPISLHSAANSPAGRMAIPRKQRRRQEYEQDVIDFGMSDAYDEGDDEDAKEQDTQMRDINVGDVESDGDDDVEPMELGSPAHHAQQQPPLLPVQDVSVPEDEVDYDDADLEAQMMAAMADEDEEDQVAVAQQEESDESEAE